MTGNSQVRQLLFAGVVLAFGAGVNGVHGASGSTLRLTGDSLRPAALVRAARGKTAVTVDDGAWARVGRSFTILEKAAEQCQKIYGLTTGVGANKDQEAQSCTAMLDSNGRLSDETIERSKVFNRALLYAHGVGVEPEIAPELVRAILIVRLNGVLHGGSGMRLPVARRLHAFIDNDILPVIPSRGSLGQASITLLAHIGLAMIGEGEVLYQGRRLAARDALAEAGLAPLQLYAKDALALFSANAYAAALAAHAFEELGHLAAVSRLVYALSLEGLNGNVTPLLKEANAARPFPQVMAVASDLRAILAGSYLWAPSTTRALQDPLSYRTAAHRLAALERARTELGELLAIQLNSAGDNPVVVFGRLSDETRKLDTLKPVVQPAGAVIPSANFSPLLWVIALERTGIALGHHGAATAQRTLRLAENHFTGLTRFLGTPTTTHAFGAIQKPFVALAGEARELANPVSLDFFAVAEQVEDVATNAPRVARRVRRLIDIQYYLLAFELMHAAQAVDLRQRADPSATLSPRTADLHRDYRRVVSTLERDDHLLSEDVARTYRFLKTCDASLSPQDGTPAKACGGAGEAAAR